MSGKKQSVQLAPLVLLILLAAGGALFGIYLIIRRSTGLQGGTADADSVAVITETVTSISATETTEALVTQTASETETTATETLAPGSVTGISLTFYETALKTGDKPVMPLVTMTPAEATDKSEIWTTTDPAVATVDGLGNITPVSAGDCVVRVTSANNPAVFAEVKVHVTGAGATDKATEKATEKVAEKTTETTAVAPQRSDIEVIDGLTYVQGVLIANKTYALPKTYNPGGILPEAQTAFDKMAAAASQDGYSLQIVSGFRSYEFQDTLYHNYCARDGQAAADRFSARAGHSEHQTGLAMDINCAGDAFNDTPEAKWIAENCWKYGFIIRYPKGKEEITGYKYESWHVRYLGDDLAKKVFDSGLTLEEYFNITSVYAE